MVQSPIVRFVLVGGLAAVINVTARIVFNTVTSYEFAIVLAFPVALTVAFALNRRFVFQGGEGNRTQQYIRFTIVNLLALVQVWLVSIVLDRWLMNTLGSNWHRETIAHAVGVLSPVATSYAAHKYFTFAKDNFPLKRS
ncbi:GtrA family protein [Rhizobium sp. LjRoot258]|uniref:GtrA family protein n=1 Tax=Rhizobium sp. LjRoot258 TaxID=3342299 RepID=UPI003ED0CE21